MKRYLQLSHIILFIALVNITSAQTKDFDASIDEIFISDVEHFFDVGIGLAKSPFTASTSNYYTTGAIVGTTTLLFTADKSVRTFALSNQLVVPNKLFEIDKYYGTGYTALFTASLYSYGLFTKNNSIRELGLNTSTAFIYAGAITGLLKIILGRRRPNHGKSNLHFKPFRLINDTYHSLPSGHTTVVFAVSTVMANYLDNSFWKILWYGSAGVVGLARIYHNKHWVSDVFLGAAIGYSVGNYVVNFSKSKTEYLGILITPYLSFNSVGINLKF